MTNHKSLTKKAGKLVRRIGDANLDFVQTDEAVQNIMLQGLEATRYNPKDALIWGSTYSGIGGLVIGGYGKPNEGYGAGPTRPIDHATYALRISQIQEGVPLTGGFLRKPTINLENAMYSAALLLTEEELAERTPELRKISNGQLRNPFVIVEKSGAKFRESDYPVHAEVMLANVRKQGHQYDGDIILYLVRQLGSGLNYVKYEDIYSLEGSTKTSDILSGKSTLKSNLRNVVIANQEELEGYCKSFFRCVEGTRTKKIAMLTVDNV